MEKTTKQRREEAAPLRQQQVDLYREGAFEVEGNNVTIVFSVADKKLQNGTISLTVVGYEGCS